MDYDNITIGTILSEKDLERRNVNVYNATLIGKPTGNTSLDGSPELEIVAITDQTGSGTEPAQQFESLPEARSRLESYFATNRFDNLSNGSEFKFAVEVLPNEEIYIHFAATYIFNTTASSAYAITSISTELNSITGGTTPEFDENELTAAPINRVTVNPNESAVSGDNVPFSQDLFTKIEETKGNSTTVIFDLKSTLDRDLVNQPIVLRNTTGSSRYILLQGFVEDQLTLINSEDFSIRATILYSIVKI